MTPIRSLRSGASQAAKPPGGRWLGSDGQGWLPVALAASLSGCSDRVARQHGATLGDGAGPVHVVADASVGADAAREEAAAPACPVCPASTPEAGTPCQVGEPVGGLGGIGPALCEYGDDPQSRCNTLASCAGDAGWSVRSPGADAGCPTAPPTACPPSFAAGADAGVACLARFACDYPEGTCGCGLVALRVDASPTYGWTCDALPASCPSPRPRFGTPCSPGSSSCEYAGGCFRPPPYLPGERTWCTCGIWQPLGCPTVP